jgi:hypothetical protein
LACRWLGLTSSVFLCAALGLGMLISTVSGNQFVASQVALIAGFLPAFLLSGFIFEIGSAVAIACLSMPLRRQSNGESSPESRPIFAIGPGVGFADWL